MKNSWLLALGRATLSTHRFERMFVPALSDLQLESQERRLRKCQHYIGIGAVLVIALRQDLTVELTSAFYNLTFGGVWKRAAA